MVKWPREDIGKGEPIAAAENDFFIQDIIGDIAVLDRKSVV